MPVRSYILDRCFDDEDLRYLDPYGETEEEYHDEQHAFHLQKNVSFSEDDMEFPNRAEFRGKGYQKELRQRHHLEANSDDADDLAEAGHQSPTATTSGQDKLTTSQVSSGHTE